ncbi:MAG TPA: hypothetical protein PKD72_03180, partial [Gemmatales bacterium]|nr:hypothetical protein [Gemmatales bacterium]
MNLWTSGARWIGLGAISLSVGCCWNGDVDRFADIPPGAIPEPPHSTVRRHWDTQAAKAEADDFVFYRHEFYMDGKELGPYGQYHVRLIANRLQEVPFPVLIQAVPDARLNEARRQTVILALKRAGLDDIDQRVIVGFPEAEGMSGEEAERVNASLPQAGTGVNGMNMRNNGLWNNGNFFNNG